MKNQRSRVAFGVCAAVSLFAALAAAGRAAVTLDFEGLKDREAVADFYNGGLGGDGSGPGVDHGVSFSPNALAVIDADAGGTGNFGGEPSPSTALFFLSGQAATLSYAAGFDTAFSVYYSAIVNPGEVRVYDGLNATGTVLATLALPLTPDTGAPDPTGRYSPFVRVGVAFDGVARSVDFGGTADRIAFDDITFGATRPDAIPEPGSLALLGIGGLGLIAKRRANRRRTALESPNMKGYANPTSKHRSFR